MVDVAKFVDGQRKNLARELKLPRWRARQQRRAQCLTVLWIGFAAGVIAGFVVLIFSQRGQSLRKSLQNWDDGEDDGEDSSPENQPPSVTGTTNGTQNRVGMTESL